MKFRYFSCTEGCAVARFGTDATIGARKVLGKGYVFDEGAVAAIPEDEVRRYIREYRNALRKSPLTGKASLVERKKADYDRYVAKQEATAEKATEDVAADVDSSDTVVPGEPDAAPVKTRQRRKPASGGNS